MKSESKKKFVLMDPNDFKKLSVYLPGEIINHLETTFKEQTKITTMNKRIIQAIVAGFNYYNNETEKDPNKVFAKELRSIKEGINNLSEQIKGLVKLFSDAVTRE